MRDSLSSLSSVSREEVAGISECTFSDIPRIASIICSDIHGNLKFFCSHFAWNLQSAGCRQLVIYTIPSSLARQPEMIAISIASYILLRALSCSYRSKLSETVGNAGDKQARWLVLGRAFGEARVARGIRDRNKLENIVKFLKINHLHFKKI